MGEIRVDIKLENAVDHSMFRKNKITAEKVRSHTMGAVVDTGAVMLALPIDVVKKLDLDEQRNAVVTYANDTRETLLICGPVYIELAGRSMNTECIVLPPTVEALIGQVVLETLDLIPDCQNQTLGPRPESPIYPMLNLK